VSRCADFELVIRTTVSPTDRFDREPPKVEVFRKAVFLRQLEVEGWGESALENLNDRLDNREAVSLRMGVFVQVVEFSVRSHVRVELGTGQFLFRDPGVGEK
jgi:hypothetical protein